MLLAAFLNLTGERALVVGGGRVAARRIPALLQAQMKVTVIAPAICTEVRAQHVTLMERPYSSSDLQGIRLVLACTDHSATNDAVAAEALRLGLLVSHAGAAERGNLRFPAVVERHGVQMALSTGRELPMLAQALRERLDAMLPATLPLEAWTQRRIQALTLGEAQRKAALDHLRLDIRRSLGLEA
ncbi:precorrin-2 dehydrogenase/sirohydrochlorin ferrochelatase family protein [Deinococcus sp.]|uniref:precorrin-2 dehydrogenase/sirohydrochlorin ferrochelatase family protein n=1 Tax=Deinococcus sp. TaxID=47478 RepID=UPI003CC5BBE9